MNDFKLFRMLSHVPEEEGCLTKDDKEALENLTVPIPECENDRVKILRQTKLLDSEDDSSFDRFTSLAQRIFNVTFLSPLFKVSGSDSFPN